MNSLELDTEDLEELLKAERKPQDSSSDLLSSLRSQSEHIRRCATEYYAIQRDARLSGASKRFLHHILDMMALSPNNAKNKLIIDFDEFCESFGLSPATVYSHLSKLRDAGYLKWRTVYGKTFIKYYLTEQVYSAFKHQVNSRGKQ